MALIRIIYYSDSYYYHRVPLLLYDVSLLLLRMPCNQLSIVCDLLSCKLSMTLHVIFHSPCIQFYWLVVSCGLALQVYPDAYTMFFYGSFFYAVMFIVSYPAFSSLMGTPNASLHYFAIHSLAYSMLVMLLLDFWRLYLGKISGGGDVEFPYFNSTLKARKTEL
eukprot:m.163519 g.163519  ORF g.163519 m.163519 type:complete len:164 (+) comp14391_c0_seq1:52-543(+)